jgi:hypothetical protein
MVDFRSDSKTATNKFCGVNDTRLNYNLKIPPGLENKTGRTEIRFSERD